MGAGGRKNGEHDKHGKAPTDPDGGISPVKCRKNAGGRLYRHTHQVRIAAGPSGAAKRLLPFRRRHDGTSLENRGGH
jgi:hypothetical protein